MCLSTERVCFSQKKRRCFKSHLGHPPQGPNTEPGSKPGQPLTTLEEGASPSLSFGEEPRYFFYRMARGCTGSKRIILTQPGPAAVPPFLTTCRQRKFRSPCPGRNRKPVGEGRGEGGVRALDAPPGRRSLHPRAPELRGLNASSHPSP